jgi:ABC-type glycerol-3-phosphate transport system substrate-binding protein
MRKILVLAMAAVLALAGCSVGDTNDSSSQPSGQAAKEITFLVFETPACRRSSVRTCPWLTGAT